MEANDGGPMTAFVQVGDVDASSAQGAGRDEQVANDQIVHVQLMLNASVSTVWQVLVSAEGSAAWLGEGAVLGEKGQSFHCADGSAGVVRSFHPLEQLRLSWQPDLEHELSLVEMDLTPDSFGTRLRLWHEGLPEADRRRIRVQWQNRLTLMAGLGGWATFIDG
jgi:uncharacterized protein YndB with AHSA1/START domain